MPGIVRNGDPHVGHASPTPNPFHQTTYVGGSGDVFVNGKNAIRGESTDSTGCGDPAVGKSPNVYVNGIGVHRLGDSTGGHGSWVPNASAGASTDVFANGGEPVESSYDPAAAIVPYGTCSNYDWNSGSCLDQSDNPEDPYYVG